MAAIDNYNFSGKRALIRVDFNVPLDKDTLEVTDDTRIRAALPTIQKVLKDGGSVVLMSHLGRPGNGPEAKYSLSNIVYKVEEVLGSKVIFADDCVSPEAFELTSNLKAGEIVLLENLRFYPQEKEGNVEFSKSLAKHGDVYINDAFGTAHRAHASTAVIAQFFPKDKMFGYLIEREIESVDKVLNSTEKPLTAIVGGAKVSSKITIIEQLLEKVDNIIIGGGMAFTFIKAQGGQVGSSLVEDDFLNTANEILKKSEDNGVKVFLPSDAVIADKFDNNANKKTVDIFNIDSGWMGLDIGPNSIETFEEVILNSKLILFNGPMGVFELDSFQEGTKAISNAIAKATKQGAFSAVGGGDSVAAINKYNLKDQVSFVSTGGGAMLEYLEGKELPGIAAIKN
ncbi:MAG: phosphoglycerate kinase [Crocinitomicaceae bacterium]|nr:phosphoglycerate kinase [Crocinitomicaceae bacterium]